MAIESSEFKIDEVVGCDSRQKSDLFGTMTFDEWNDLKSRSNMAPVKTREMTYSQWDELVEKSPHAKFNYNSQPPKLVVVDPSHKPDYSCVMLSEECKVELWLLFVGLVIGFCSGLFIGVLL